MTRIESFKLWSQDESKDNEQELERQKVLQGLVNENLNRSWHSHIKYRKLDAIYSKLLGMLEQGRVARLANSTHDEQAMSGYIQDIHEALTDYQVCLYRISATSQN